MSTPIPRLTPLPITPSSLPYQSGGAFDPVLEPDPLEGAGYVEEEYLLSGEVDGMPYTTPLVIRRPADPQRFCGRVVVDPVHTMGGAAEWKKLRDYMFRHGYGYARIASHVSAVDRFLDHDAERYRDCRIQLPPDLHRIREEAVNYPPVASWFKTGTPAAQDASFTDILREWMRVQISEAPASHGILAQLGALLKENLADGPFPGGTVERLYMGGHSQTGLMVLGYVSEMHDTARLADGSQIYDGYFPTGTGGTKRNIEMDPELPYIRGYDEPVRGCDAPVVHVLPEGDVHMGVEGGLDGGAMGGRELVYRRDTGDDPGDKYRLYEVAGITHNDGRRVPAEHVPADPMAPRPAHLPWRPLFGALFDLLVQWAENGVAPPPNQVLELEDGKIARDEHGNARGGVRSVPLDVPVATYLPTATYLPADSPLWQYGYGTEVPFSKEKLAGLYRNREDYLKRFDARLDELVAERFFLAADVDDLRDEAAKVDIP